MGSVQSVRSLWDQEPCYWDQLPNELQEKIYREAVNNMSPRELAAERYANAPGGWKHWLRTSPIGPQLAELVSGMTFTFGATERGRSLVLKDMVKLIMRFQDYGGNPLSIPLRPARRQGFMIYQEADRDGPGVRIGVNFIIDNESIGAGANQRSPWLKGKWFTHEELNS